MTDPVIPPATPPAAEPPAAAPVVPPAAPPEGAAAPPSPGTLLGGDAPAVELGPDGKPKGEVQTPKPEDAKPVGAPEKYEFTAPEGMTLDQAAIGEFEPVFREANLSQEQAQALITKYGSFAQAQQQAQAEAWGNQITAWGESVKVDKEIGGESFDANAKLAVKVMDKFGTPELKGLMGIASPENPTGLGIGNHPELVRLMVRIGKAMSEDTFIPAPNEGGGQKDLAHQMYPDMK